MTKWFDKYLVPEWRDSWRFASVQIAAVASAAGGVVASNPNLLLNLINYLPAHGWIRAAIISLVVVTVFIIPTLARLWDQGARDDDASE